MSYAQPLPSRDGYDRDEIEGRIHEMGETTLPIPLDVDREFHAGHDFTIYFTQENADGEPHVVHAIYNDIEAAESWIGTLQAMSIEAAAEEIIVRRDAYGEIEQLGHGDYVRGLNIQAQGVRK